MKWKRPITKRLDRPKEYILDNGGQIFVALYNCEPLGVCALIKTQDHYSDFEKAKMAVSPQAQGKNMGYLLGVAVINAARKAGANVIPRKQHDPETGNQPIPQTGFQKIVGHSSLKNAVTFKWSLF